MKKGVHGLFFQGMQPIIGSVIGVGIFGLPFVFAQAGFWVGMVHMIVVVVVNTLLLVLYADVIRNTPGVSRMAGLVDRYVGREASWVATLFLFTSTWGAMIAYIILGGDFLFALLEPVLGGELMVYQLVFFAVSSLLLIGGLSFIAHLEVVFVLALLIMLTVVVAGSVPHVELSFLNAARESSWFLPFGVVLFAFGGLAAVPEAAHILAKQRDRLLRPVILASMAIVFLVYVAFSAVVVGVTGPLTTQDAITGLGSIVGEWVLVVGAVIGLFSVFTSFLILGISVMDTLVYDFKWRYLRAWALACSVPFVAFLLGARDFIDVIGFTGGFLGSLIGLIVLYLYVRAKRDVCTPKRCLTIPDSILVAVGFVFAAGAVLTVLQAFSVLS